MTKELAVAEQPKSILIAMASKFEMSPDNFERVIRATCMPKGEVTREQFAAFLIVAREHNLNPLTKEIYAFPNRGGGIIPVVGVDGWAKIINAHPMCNGITFKDEFKGDKLFSVTCSIHRKDRDHPVEAIEYMSECLRGTDTWKQWPNRMLRHKALIQCARYAFSFAGIYDPDEAERIVNHTDFKVVKNPLSDETNPAIVPLLPTTEEGEITDE